MKIKIKVKIKAFTKVKHPAMSTNLPESRFFGRPTTSNFNHKRGGE